MLKQLAALQRSLKHINRRESLKRPTVQRTLELLAVEYFQVRRDELRIGLPVVVEQCDLQSVANRRDD
jgi:hypothetical protein